MHYSIAVITETKPDYDIIADKLAPFQEYDGCTTPEMQIEAVMSSDRESFLSAYNEVRLMYINGDQRAYVYRNGIYDSSKLTKDHRQELQGKSQFQETERHFDHIHPTAGFRHTLKHIGEDGKNAERNCQRKGETKHSYSRSHNRTHRCSLHQQRTDNRSGTRERNQSQGKGHEEYTQNSGSGIRFSIQFIGPRRWQNHFESTKK